ncbi:hypothetical protein P7C71_g5364, partial [Lecanoromycetidae sp. Uapishka_2]
MSLSCPDREALKRDSWPNTLVSSYFKYLSHSKNARSEEAFTRAILFYEKHYMWIDFQYPFKEFIDIVLKYEVDVEKEKTQNKKNNVKPDTKPGASPFFPGAYQEFEYPAKGFAVTEYLTRLRDQTKDMNKVFSLLGEDTSELMFSTFFRMNADEKTKRTANGWRMFMVEKALKEIPDVKSPSGLIKYLGIPLYERIEKIAVDMKRAPPVSSD